LETQLLQATGFGQFGNKAKDTIRTYITAVTKMWTTETQKALYELSQKQSLDIRGARVDFANFQQTQNALELEILQKNSDVLSAATNVANSLKEQYDGSWNADKTLILVLSLVGVLVLAAIIALAIHFGKKGKASSGLTPGTKTPTVSGNIQLRIESGVPLEANM
jgi:hypothetical protein